MTKISIITIFKNEEKNLAATLNSLLIQTVTNFECILINGNSKDSSLQIIEECIGSDSRFHVYNEESQGISNAFNQAIRLAKSPFLLFLNGGDCLSRPDALSILYNLSKLYPNSIVSCHSEYITESGEKTKKYYPPSPFQVKNLEWYCAISHQATLIPLSFFNLYGGYIPSFQIAMDYELWLRAAHLKYPIVASNEVIAYHREGGASFKNINRGRKEQVCTRLLHLPTWRWSLLKDVIQLGLTMLPSRIY